MNKYDLIGLKNERDTIFGSIDYLKLTLKDCTTSRDQFTLNSLLHDAEIRLCEFDHVLKILGIKL